jgi:release factor glutamine methyltransferase
MRVMTLPGVFRPHSDSWLLAGLVKREPGLPGAEVLDVCTGSGVIAVAAAQAGAARVDAVDLSRRAVATVRANAALNGVSVSAHRGDLFAPLGGRRFDLITSNPPYLPGDDELPTRGAQRAWEGGSTGRVLIDRILRDAPAHLNPGGRVLMVHSSVCGIEETLEHVRAGGLEADVIHRSVGPIGGILGARAEELERRGILEPGQRDEEMVVVAGTAPERTPSAPRGVSDPAPTG